VFWPVLGHQFLDWDDDHNLVNNRAYRGLGWTNLRFMFTTTLLGHWIPATWLSFGADYLAWGMNPRGYHLTSLAIHLAATLACFVLARDLLRRTMDAGARPIALGALAAALFFAIHPLRVESVAWVTERRDVLSGLWFLLALIGYLQAADATGPRRRWWLAASIAAYALAGMSKAIVMTLPAVLVLLDVYPLRRLSGGWRGWRPRAARGVWLEKLPYLAIALATAAMAIHAQRGLADTVTARPIEGRVAVALYGLGFYVWKTLVPWPIAPLYQIPTRVDPFAPAMLAGAATAIAITVALVWLRRRWPAGLAVWLSYVILVSPVSGLTQSGPQLVAARYTYLACLGFALLAGALVVWLARMAETPVGRSRALAACAVVAAWLAALGVLTWRETYVWRDSETLWSTAVAMDPGSPIAHNNLGFVYLSQGRLDAADREIRISPGLSPEWDQARQNLAFLLAKQGRLREAGEARVELGYTLLKQGKYDAAVELFGKEVEARPTDAAARNNLGAALLLRGEVRRAIAELEHAVRLDPSYERAQRNLAAARQRL
jgi:tetratricopeptide (TPR) repeat protein